jgi:hypothetical protein
VFVCVCVCEGVKQQHASMLDSPPVHRCMSRVERAMTWARAALCVGDLVSSLKGVFISLFTEGLAFPLLTLTPLFSLLPLLFLHAYVGGFMNVGDLFCT